ncbi:MAG: D-glycero-beta-D-manno-heptose 1,7-bisphosphate 7-phosphatase [Methylococcaceae bacterium]|nr:D-glycero-beta-D-manno-heptose 1,7-bisphosphate 7-phosphatase [Methylococcaceae bacterium]
MRWVILDRDGVINEDSDAYIKSPEEWIPIPGSLEAIAQLNRGGYHIAVLTNQSGVARGLFDLNTLEQIHRKMRKQVGEAGGCIEAIFVCPHGPEEGCECRKPKSGLFEQFTRQYPMDLSGVPAVGDSLRDIQAALRAGAEAILVETGKGKKTLRRNPDLDVPTFVNLHEAVQYILFTQG